MRIMTDNTNTHIQTLTALLNDDLDALESMKAEDVRELAKANGDDLEHLAASTRNLLLSSLMAAAKDRRRAFSANCASENAKIAGSIIPDDLDMRRSMLMSMLKTSPALAQGITLHNREFSDLSDGEVELYLKQLILLGVKKD